ncbi:hypothetical protein EDD17DRAFT_1465514 [Pisolithus thermaeus]|nr:hypothetical protein EV401DRAFT_1871412 [Pisolithus croceorrhizus]KAI6168563.1 hypothetical protein EDD17DRAFT_1465514 [Pisolithus thermaeus]
MEPIRQQDNSQKDLLASLFPELTGDSHRPALDAHQTTLNSGLIQGQRTPNLQLSSGVQFNPPMDLLAMSNLVSVHSMDPNHQNLPSASTFTPQLLLEQQYKLTQLHQLQQLQSQIQNQIFQQQLRPLPDSDFLNRLNTPYTNSQQNLYDSQALENMPLPSPQEPVGTNYYMRHPGSASAPANIAFHTSPPFPLPSPSDLDIDQQPVRHTAKRAASPSAEDYPQTGRKRPTPAPTAVKKAARNAKSATSTPLLRSVKGRRNSTIAENDSPSPVDLSMPPPAPPGANSSPPLPTPVGSSTVPSQEDTRITPVTPASIMNLGRLGISSSLAPTSQASRGAKSDKGKELPKPKPPAETASAKSSRRATLSLISPGPKPILPAGSPATVNHGSSTVPQPVPLTRKSHKDAEQKRRDSLKTAYDDLRTLLPPIPLPSDENFPDEPILPGALPPRGPPKAGGDGPNKGVSKLQLLRCGNDYIRRLKERVDRRDKEIADLRKEVLRLRIYAGDNAFGGGEESIDLDKDLDAVEAGNRPLGQSGEDDGDDGDE